LRAAGQIARNRGRIDGVEGMLVEVPVYASVYGIVSEIITERLPTVHGVPWPTNLTEL
jgi:hypothetical protein